MKAILGCECFCLCSWLQTGRVVAIKKVRTGDNEVSGVVWNNTLGYRLKGDIESGYWDGLGGCTKTLGAVLKLNNCI